MLLPTFLEYLVQLVLLQFFNQLHTSNSNISRINYVTLTLIPKKEGTRAPSDFHLITLIHSYIKTFTKVSANRLQPFLEALIDPAQITYIRGRYILDNFFYANEILHLSRKSKVNGIIYKLDFSKAFDRIILTYLIDVLHHHRFSMKWINWIQNVLLSIKVAATVN